MLETTLLFLLLLSGPIASLFWVDADLGSELYLGMEKRCDEIP